MINYFYKKYLKYKKKYYLIKGGTDLQKDYIKAYLNEKTVNILLDLGLNLDKVVKIIKENEGEIWQIKDMNISEDDKMAMIFEIIMDNNKSDDESDDEFDGLFLSIGMNSSDFEGYDKEKIIKIYKKFEDKFNNDPISYPTEKKVISLKKEYFEIDEDTFVILDEKIKSYEGKSKFINKIKSINKNNIIDYLIIEIISDDILYDEFSKNDIVPKSFINHIIKQLNEKHENIIIFLKEKLINTTLNSSDKMINRIFNYLYYEENLKSIIYTFTNSEIEDYLDYLTSEFYNIEIPFKDLDKKYDVITTKPKIIQEASKIGNELGNVTNTGTKNLLKMLGIENNKRIRYEDSNQESFSISDKAKIAGIDEEEYKITQKALEESLDENSKQIYLWLQEKLNKDKLKLENALAVGNCFFESIGIVLRTYGIVENVNNLRKLLHEHLVKNKDLIYGSLDEETKDDYIKLDESLKNPESYIENNIQVAEMAKVLKRPIRVFYNQKDKREPETFGEEFPNQLINLINFQQTKDGRQYQHYDALVYI